jgi:uncharacterized membrane protein YkoI
MMKMKAGWYTLFAVIVVAGLGYAGANQASEDHEEARALREAGEILPLAQVLERAQKDQPGRVLESELEREDGRYVYELEVVGDDGVVRKLYYDARDGSRLDRKPEDKQDDSD